MTATDQSAERGEYVIRHASAFYRPNAQGYTYSIAEAGRWLKEEAEKYVNNDPQHTVTIHPVSEFIDKIDAELADGEKRLSELRAMRAALTPPVDSGEVEKAFDAEIGLTWSEINERDKIIAAAAFESGKREAEAEITTLKAENETNAVNMRSVMKRSDDLQRRLAEAEAENERLTKERDEAVKQERESCAFAAETVSGFGDPWTIETIAANIRARGQGDEKELVHVPGETFEAFKAAESENATLRAENERLREENATRHGLANDLSVAHFENAALRKALEPFGDIDGEGDEDYPDEKPVTVTFGRCIDYTLKLGDFRNARALLNQNKDQGLHKGESDV